MAEYIIFERSIIRNDPINDVFIKLVCDQPNEIRRYTPIKFTIQEILNSCGFVANLLINDANGDLFNHMKLHTSAVFNVSFGHSLDNEISVDMKVLSYRQVNQTMGRPHDMQLMITFGSVNWYEMTVKGFGRGWANSTYSDVVADVVADLNFSETDIGGTNGTIKSIIQPNWTNKKFLEYVCERAKTDNQTQFGNFMFTVDLDNKFTFKSFDQLVNDNRSSLISGRVPVIRMDATPDSNSETERQLVSNEYVSPTFNGIEMVESLAKGCQNGASGQTAGHYDWESGQFVSTAVDVGSIPLPQLSDYTSIREEFNGNTVYVDYGRDVDSETIAKNKVAKANLNISKINVISDGMPKIHIFDFIELIIQNTSLGSSVPVNEMYSGFYMVGGVKHSFTFDNTISYSTETVLMRHGVDSYDYDGFDDLVSSSVGKIT